MDKNTQTAAPKTKAKTALFTKEKDTKNTVKFAEVAIEGQAPICGTLYLQKWFVGNAQTIRVEVEAQ
jgi:hypothetical protein